MDLQEPADADASSKKHEDVLSISIKPSCKLSFRQFSSILLHEIEVFPVSISFCFCEKKLYSNYWEKVVDNLVNINMYKSGL